MAKQTVEFGDLFRVTDLSDQEAFKLSVECGDFMGPDDIHVKVIAEESRLVIEASKMQNTGGVEVVRQINYEHEMPKGIDGEQVKAGWDQTDNVLVIEAPLPGE